MAKCVVKNNTLFGKRIEVRGCGAKIAILREMIVAKVSKGDEDDIAVFAQGQDI